MQALKKIVRDALGIARVCGYPLAIKWLFNILASWRVILKGGDLQPADRAMGDGPFTARRGGAQALLSGTQVFSGIREIWVRDVYLRHNFLTIPAGGVVLDLGANLGVFSTLALAQAASVSVVAVEASGALLESLQQTVRMNGWADRLTPIRAFIGTFTQTQESALRQGSDYAETPVMHEEDLIARCSLTKIDFLKCDIEGSEFFLLQPESRLLAITDRLAIELHAWGGNMRAFLDHLERVGYEIGHVEWSPDSCIALCKRKLPRPSELRSRIAA